MEDFWNEKKRGRYVSNGVENGHGEIGGDYGEENSSGGDEEVDIGDLGRRVEKWYERDEDACDDEDENDGDGEELNRRE